MRCGSVAELRWAGATTEIARERLRPVVHVTARSRASTSAPRLTRIKQLLSKMVLPAGVSLEYGGLYQQQQQAFHQLALVLVAGTGHDVPDRDVGVRAACACAGHGLIAALACLAGSFVALALTGITLNISSFMGIIMVAGITAKNGILLLDHAEHGVAVGRRARQGAGRRGDSAAAADPDDHAGDRCRPVAARARLRRGRQGSAAAGSRGHRRTGASRCCCHSASPAESICSARALRGPSHSTPPDNPQ